MSRAVRSGTRADTVVLAVCGALALFLIVSPLRVRDAVAAGLRRSVVAPLVVMQQRAEKSRSAFLSQDARTIQRDSIALRALAVPSLQAENDRLRQLLGLAGRLDWGFIPAEALHGRGAGDDFSMTLTAGSRAGVREFSPVVAPEGLVGMVQTTDPTMSLAILWSHPDFRASAMAADGSAFGIVAAHLGAGAERYLLELRGVPFRSTLEAGAVIVTSGLGGVYPRGIPIGVVMSEVKTAEEAWARTYLLRPMVMPSDVHAVMILHPRRTAEGVENVWQVAASVDASARRVATAGDSIARATAEAEARARRAALDSTRAAAAQAAGVAPGAVPLGGTPLSPPPAAPGGRINAPGTPTPSNPARPPAEAPPGSGATRPVTPVRPRPAPTTTPTVDSAGRPVTAPQVTRPVTPPPVTRPAPRPDSAPPRTDSAPPPPDSTPRGADPLPVAPR